MLFCETKKKEFNDEFFISGNYIKEAVWILINRQKIDCTFCYQRIIDLILIIIILSIFYLCHWKWRNMGFPDHPLSKTLIWKGQNWTFFSNKLKYFEPWNPHVDTMTDKSKLVSKQSKRISCFHHNSYVNHQVLPLSLHPFVSRS